MAKTTEKTAQTEQPSAQPSAQPLPEKGSGSMVKAGSTKLPAHLAGRMKEVGGKGVSTDKADNLVPFVAVLQDGNPETKKNNAKYIEGAEPGMIWVKGAPEDFQFVAGQDGILVQPCYFYKDFVEWRLRDNGGGFVGRHSQPPATAKEVVDPKNSQKVKWVMPNSNEIVETRYHVVRILRDDGTRFATIVPFTSTGHTVSKGWMTMMGNSRLEDGSPAPSFAKLYRMRLKTKTNAAGTWFLFNIVDEGWVEDVADFEAGLALNTDFEKGTKKGDDSTLDQGGEGDAQSQNM